MATIYDQVQRLRSDLETLGADLLDTDQALRTEFKSWGLRSGAKALRKTAKRLQDLGDTAVNQANDLNAKILEKVGDSQERAQKVSVLLGETAARLERSNQVVKSGGIGRKLAGVAIGLAAAGAIAAVAREMCRKP
ncbi:hypothetical protein [Gluconacetobacter takamatsuzukensis]|uniref:Uncharacterized protein n=1 Tax=Gluconacetobacter takamatsuzukensis TaxID=1286190 RepID=A0A7W4PQI1_9PROT|nr:hypothetical protein [Gluconacetobacter takamatsuzukensis]MBB2206590.1 hypothetical protein [Gluconacetobacter takamatsuzukensis]